MWESQTLKRNCYFIDAELDEWFLILDGDEILNLVDWNEFWTQLEMFDREYEGPCLVTIPHIRYRPDGTSEHSGNLARLLKYGVHAHYHIRHGILHDENCKKVPKIGSMNRGVCEIHHVIRKNKKRRKQQLEYKSIMRKRKYIEPVDAPR